MKQPTTKQGAYLQDQAQHGVYRQKLAEAALAVAEAYTKADPMNRTEFGTRLAKQFYVVLSDVYGWPWQEAMDKADELVNSFVLSVNTYGPDDPKGDKA